MNNDAKFAQLVDRELARNDLSFDQRLWQYGYATEAVQEDLLKIGYLSNQNIEPGNVEVVFDSENGIALYNVYLKTDQIREYEAFKAFFDEYRLYFTNREIDLTSYSFFNKLLSKTGLGRTILGDEEIKKIKDERKKIKSKVSVDEFKEITIKMIQIALLNRSVRINLEFNIRKMVRDTLGGELLPVIQICDIDKEERELKEMKEKKNESGKPKREQTKNSKQSTSKRGRRTKDTDGGKDSSIA